MRIVALDSFQQFAAINLSLDPGAVGGPVVIPSCAQIVLNWTLEDGKTGHNVLYGRYSGTFAGTVAQADGIKSALTTGANWTGLAAFLATSSALASVSIRNVGTANQPLILSTGAASAGTSASPALPNEVAVVVTIRTAFVGQAYRGRMYIPGWATNALGAGNVVAAAATSALVTWSSTNISAALTGQGYTPVLGQKARQQYTSASGTVHPARQATSVTIASFGVRNNTWDSQRRRGLK